MLDEEYGEVFPFIAQAQEMISTLTALKEEIDWEQARDAQLHKEEQERNAQLCLPGSSIFQEKKLIDCKSCVKRSVVSCCPTVGLVKRSFW